MFGYIRIAEYRDGRICGSLSESEQQRAIAAFEELRGSRPLADVAIVYIHNDYDRIIAVWIERGWIDDSVDIAIDF